ncbi:O-antigen ligase family protein [Pontibacter anaerobius]|uniref:O-antigen ligase family protein n=1 Tax=Pontibacter anaerobius TaxID=2993940 RepID=A0ABT3RII8_9BACT|nr:O-antigen ligase family protein [Pontibacter anaerobius]MCX2741163.1 O-antigen ligase family protein [Pontibacter anaerobius]
MKLNYSFIFAFPLMMIMLLDPMFLELLSGNDEARLGSMLSVLVKLNAGIAFLYSLYRFQSMSSFMRFVFVLVTLYVFGMVFESYYKYSSFFIYPHVFLRLLLFYFVFFTYTFYKNNDYLRLSHIINFILIGFVLNVVLIHPDALSLSSFTNHERGVNATTMYMLVIPFLYFASQYLFVGGLYNMIMSFVVVLAIIFFQHRTVWVCMVGILVVYVYLVKFKADKPVNFGKLLPIAMVVAILGIVSSAFLFSIHPEIITKLQENFSDIENASEQGTGGWRYNQFLSYLPFIKENFIMGMRFEGFELPIQFYRDDLDAPVFEDGNGHHFHSFYVDVLFYVGFVGMLMFMMMYFYSIVKGFTRRLLNEKQIVLLAFITSGLVYGISYILPYFFYAFLGLAIAYLEQDMSQYSFLPDFGRRRKERIRKLRLERISIKQAATSY